MNTHQDCSWKERTLFIGGDVHKDTHTLVAENHLGEELLVKTVANDPADFRKLLDQIRQTATVRHLTPLIGLEDAVGYGWRLASFFHHEGLPVKIINPVLVKRERDRSAHPDKSDYQDAKGVVKVMVHGERTDRLPAFSYRITEEGKVCRALKMLVNERDFLVNEQRMAAQRLHTLLHHTYGSGYQSLFNELATLKALKFWSRFPSARRCRATTSKGLVKPEWIKTASVDDLPLCDPVAERQVVRYADRLLALHEELRVVEKEIQSEIGKLNSHLATIPGCGLMTAAKVHAEVGDPDRFTTRAQFARYAALAPRDHSSGKRTRQKRDPRGNRVLNEAIHHIALTQISPQGIPEARDYFQKKIKEGMSKRHALTCLKRQLINVVFVILKERRPFEIRSVPTV